MHSSNTVPVICLGIVKRVSRDPFRSIPGDQFDRLHDTVHNLEHEQREQTL